MAQAPIISFSKDDDATEDLIIHGSWPMASRSPIQHKDKRQSNLDRATGTQELQLVPLFFMLIMTFCGNITCCCSFLTSTKGQALESNPFFRVKSCSRQPAAGCKLARTRAVCFAPGLGLICGALCATLMLIG